MSYASDKLYNGYLRKKMALIVSRVKVREIVPHLACLTDSDREEIEAKRETSGNYVAMQHLLSCLRRRENWAEEFITALDACEQTTMAEEIRAEYNSLRTPNSPRQPPPPSARVIEAHVHPEPPPHHPPSVPDADEGPSAASPPVQAAAAASPEPVTPVSQPVPQAPSQPQALANPAPPAKTPPADAPPAETPPADAPPAETPPADAPPAETPPADAPPVNVSPADAPPVNATPADTPPVDVPQSETPRAEAPTSPASSAETSPTETALTDAETPQAEAPLSPTSPAETSPSDALPTDATLVETPQAVTPQSPTPLAEEALSASQPPPQTPPPSPKAEVVPEQVTLPPLSPAAHEEVTTATSDGGSSPQEPVENCEIDFKDVASDKGMAAEETPAVNWEGSGVIADANGQSEESEEASTCQPDPDVQTAPPEVNLPHSSILSETEPTNTPDDGSTTGTQEKLPIQDTSPPVNVKVEKVKASCPVADEVSEPPESQISENSQMTKMAEATSAAVDVVEGADASVSHNGEKEDDDDDMCMSKPGPLVSSHVDEVTCHPDISLTEPYSGGSDRLEISEAVPQVAVAGTCAAVEATDDPACTARSKEVTVMEDPVTLPASLPVNEPEENSYETLPNSFGDVRENVVYVSGEPSIQNLEGQTPSMLGNNLSTSDKLPAQNHNDHPQIVVESPSSMSPESSCHSCEDQGGVSQSESDNAPQAETENMSQGKACVSEELQVQTLNGQTTTPLAEGHAPSPPAIREPTGPNAPTSQTLPSLEGVGARDGSPEKPQSPQDPVERVDASSMPSSSRYLLAAAGMGACALLVAWRLRH